MPFFNFDQGFGGLWSKGTDVAAPPFTAKEARNLRFVPGGMRSQYGFDRIVPTKTPDNSRVVDIYDYQDGTSQCVICTSADKILQLDEVTPAWTTLKSGQSTTGGLAYPASFVTAFGRCYINNGVDDPLIYDKTDVYLQSIPQPTPAPTATGSSGQTDAGFGEFNDFSKYNYFYGSTNPGGGAIWDTAQDVPDGWDNVNRTRCRKTADVKSSAAAVVVYSGYEDEPIGGPGKGLQHISQSNIDINNASALQFTQNIDSRDRNPEWLSQIVPLLNAGDKQVRIGSQIRNVVNVSGFFNTYVVTVDASFGFTTNNTINYEYFKGPFDGRLRLDITDHPDFQAGLTGGVAFMMTASVWVKSALASNAYVYLAGDGVTGEAGGTGETASAFHTGGDTYEQLTVTHTFDPADADPDNKGYLNLIVTDTSTSSTIIRNPGKFDEARVIAGATPPSTGGDLSGTFKYRIQFVDEGDGTFSPPSDESNVVEVDGGIVTLSAIPDPTPITAPSHPITHIYIYRARALDDKGNFGSFFFVGKVAVGTTTFTDTVPQNEAIQNDILNDAVGPAPKGRWMVIFEGRMVIANPVTPAEPRDARKLYYSEVNSFGHFPDDNFLEIDTGDNTQITGMAVQGGRLVIFTYNAIYEIRNLGDPFERVLKLHDGAGCYFGKTISVFEGIIFFFSSDAAYALNPDSTLTRLSDEIEGLWDISYRPNDSHRTVIQDKKLWTVADQFLGSFDMEQDFKYSLNAPLGFFFTAMESVRRQTGTDMSYQLYFSDNKGYIYKMDKTYFGFGANSGTLSGTALGTHTSTTIEDSTASWLTAGDGLESINIIKIHLTDPNDPAAFTTEQRIIDAGNTATSITVTAAWTTVPVDGDSYIIAPIALEWRSNLIDFGNEGIKKLLKRVRFAGLDEAAPGGPALFVQLIVESDRLREEDFYAALMSENGPWFSTRQRGYLHSVGFKYFSSEKAVVIKDLSIEYEGKSNNL